MIKNWSKYQNNLFNEVRNAKDNIVVSATAGSGKTTALVEIARIIASGEEYSQNPNGNFVFLAFNKSIQLELNDRLPNGFESKTLNSFGFAFLRNINKYWKIDSRKYMKLAQAIVSRLYHNEQNQEQYKIALTLVKAADMCRNNLVEPNDSPEFWQTMFDYNIDILDSDIPLIQAILIAGEWLATDRKQQIENNYARLIIQDVIKNVPKRYIDFTDQIWLSLKWNLVKPEYDIILVDEAQDLNKMQLEMVLQALNHTGRGIFVGDKSQSIYGFAGADHNSIDNIITATDAKVLPLSITYRCPLSHVELAKQIDPSIEASDNAKEGIVATIESNQLVNELMPHYQNREQTLVLCRVNAPLVKYAFMLLANRIPAKIKGKEIGKSIVNVIQKIAKKKSFDFDEFHAELYQWYTKEYQKMAQKKAKEVQMQMLTDKYDTILALYDGINPHSLNQFCDEIEAMFTEESGVIVLSSVHKSKGLEAKNVFILRPDKLPLIWKNQTEKDLIQEMNIKFVALTRSKNKLVFVNHVDEDGY